MPFAELISTLATGQIRCDACQWRCALPAGELGRCLVRRFDHEGIELLTFGMVSGATVAPIEDHRLWHFFPDSMALAIGGWGYSFPADQRQGPYAQPPDDDRSRRRLDPSRAASFALEKLCRGVIWAYGEPAVSHEYLLQLLQLSKASSRYTAVVGSGFMTTEALDAWGPYLQGMLLDLRAFDDAAYERLTGVREWRGVLETALRAQTRWGCHLEVMTRLHPGVNDSPLQLAELVAWLHDALGAATPWHVLPGDAGAAAQASVVRARRLAAEGGLAFVYGPEANQATRCPQCAAVAIEREGGRTRLVGIDDNGNCSQCGHGLNLRRSIFRR